MTTTVTELYGELWGREDAAFDAAVERSLAPRGPDLLFERFVELGVRVDDTVLDIGSRDATYAVRLVERFGCRVVAVDPVALHVKRARERVADAGMIDRIAVARAGVEALSIADGGADHVWCRDVLNHVDLPRGIAECARVLRPGGGMLVYQTFGTDWIEPREARQLYEAMAIRAANMAPTFFEATARGAGLEILDRDRIDSEWRERWVEEGERGLLDDLLRVARMRRTWATLVERFGEARVSAAYADSLWGVYQMLGKLCPTVYLLRKPAA